MNLKKVTHHNYIVLLLTTNKHTDSGNVFVSILVYMVAESLKFTALIYCIISIVYYIMQVFSSSQLFEPVHEKTNNLGFRPGLTQTGLYNHRRWLEAGNFVFK